jgi:hypothetical protein
MWASYVGIDTGIEELEKPEGEGEIGRAHVW